MDAVFGFTGIFAFIAMPVGLIMMLFKNHRKRGLQVVIASIVALPVFIFGITGFKEYSAKQDGFLSSVDRYLAKEAGYTSAEEWNEVRDDVFAKKREEEKALDEMVRKKVAEAEAAKQAKEDARIAKMAAKLQRMTDSIISAFRQYYNFEAQPLIPGKPFCREGFLDCHIVAETFNIRIYGAGIVDVPTTTQSSHAHYREICAAVFSAISGSSLDFSAEAINGAYLKASQAGSFKHDLADTQITIRPDSNGLMGCRFFKYGN
ncbi:MAG: hypothetical protein OIF58_07385 [Cohaesibacter sp.]|nr:hypothetical protein [Cohaesibacter sp.]